MEVSLSVLANAANTSSTGKLNLLGVFQSFSASGTPVQYPMFSVVIVIRATSEEKGTRHSLALELTDPDMRPVNTFEPLPFDIPVETDTPYAEVNIILNLQNFVFPVYGDYQFHISIDGARMAKHIDVLVQPLIQATAE